MNIQGGGRDRAHEAATILVRDAYRAAGDPTISGAVREGCARAAEKLYFAGMGSAVTRGRSGRGAPAGRGGAGAGGGSARRSRRRQLCDALAHVSEIATDAKQSCQGVGRAAAAAGRRMAGAAGRLPGGPSTRSSTTIPARWARKARCSKASTCRLAWRRDLRADAPARADERWARLRPTPSAKQAFDASTTPPPPSRSRRTAGVRRVRALDRWACRHRR